jgi:hypothetical protein
MPRFPLLACLLVISGLAGLALPPGSARADAEVQRILRAVHERDRGDDSEWDVTIDLTDRNGSVRKRTGKIYRRNGADGRNEQVTVFLSPQNIRHTALLDVEDAGGDNFMWLYLPALKMTKRVPPADRGDKFVGTDFTMEDVNLGFRYRDYTGEILERTSDGGHPAVVMRLEPRTAALKRGLGFDHATTTVRTDQAIIVDQRFYKGSREIRHNQALDVRRVDGVLTPMTLTSEDLVNDHRTVLRVRKAEYNKGVSASLFRKEALAREMYR